MAVAEWIFIYGEPKYEGAIRFGLDGTDVKFQQLVNGEWPGDDGAGTPTTEWTFIYGVAGLESAVRFRLNAGAPEFQQWIGGVFGGDGGVGTPSTEYVFLYGEPKWPNALRFRLSSGVVEFGVYANGAWTDDTSGGGGASASLIPLNTPLIFVGDSITNVSTAASSNHRAYRHWFNVFCNGHFYCTPASNQGTGGAVLTSQAGATTYIGLREDFWLSQVRAGAAVMFAIGTNDMANASATLAIMQATLTAHIEDVHAAGGIVFLPLIPKSIGNQSFNANPEINLTKWTAYNAWLETLHNPAGGIYVLTSAVDNIDDSLTYTYDNLHYNGRGARLRGYYDALDIAEYLDTSESLLYGVTAPGSNLEANWDLSGTGGTAGTGATGNVATGWSTYCSSNGTSGGATIGVTATCSKTTIDIPGVGTGLPAQQIDVSGTTSALGILTLINSITGLSLQYGDYIESWAYVKVSATDGTNAPVGVPTLYGASGNTSAIFSKTVDANSGLLTGAFEGVLRAVPTVRLSNSASESFEVSIGLISGAVDLRIIVAQMGARPAENVAYAAPFNLGGDMSVLGGFTNPIGNRPRLNGTAGVGNSLTLQPATINGGGPTVRQCRVVRNGVTVVATKNAGDNPMTYVQQAGDSGTTLTLEQDFTNSFGSITTVSDGIVVP